MENLASPWFKPGIDQGNVMAPMKPETSLQMIAVDDVGKYGLWAFEKHEMLNGRAFDIAGDSLTMPEVARILSTMSGRKIGYMRIPIEEVRKFSVEAAAMYEWFDRVGYDADIAGISRESGIRPTPFKKWAAAVKW